jgi:hypothetical protein
MSNSINNDKAAPAAVARQNSALDSAHNAAEAVRRQAGLPAQKWPEFSGAREGRPPSSSPRGKR